MTANTPTPVASDQRPRALAIIKAELELATVASNDPDFPRQLFPDPSDDDIDAFLETTPFYDTEKRRWVNLPTGNVEEKYINIPMTEILGNILEGFDLSSPNPANRKLWDLATKKAQRLAYEKEKAEKEEAARERNQGVAAAKGETKEKGQREESGTGWTEQMENEVETKAQGKAEENQADKKAKKSKDFPKAMQHSEAVLTEAFSVPDAIFTGVGQGFSIDDKDIERPLYRASLGIVDYKRDHELEVSLLENTAQLGVYSRQSLNHQPNRNFVRAANVSNERIRLFHFDRSGVKYSLLYNIHSNARMFVRIILGLASADPAQIGFDPTIVWEPIDGRTGQFKRGTITSRTVNNEVIVHDIIGVEPFYQRRDLVGRGTLCWEIVMRPVFNQGESEAEKPDGRAVVTSEKGDSREDNGMSSKESWCSESRTSEEVYLTAAVGVKGVGQMVACEDVVDTASFRGANAAQDPGFVNRIKRRVILKKYGPPIHKFKKILDVLFALIDAIRAHQRMVQKGILHRDISVNNILLGVNGSDSEEGWRGVLIDFDMAIFISRLEFLSKEVRTGTRMFQSLNVLDGWRTHDFLDDLESFLYVLTFLVFAFPEPGQDERELPEQLQEWNRDELDKAFSSKSTFINYGLRKLAVPPKWGPHIETLIDDLCGYFQPIHKASCRMANPKLSEAKYDKMSQSFKKRYLENRDEQYDEVVGYFEDAISAILADQTCPEATGSIRTSPVARKGHNKRESQEACPDDAEEPSPKRSRC